jgi:hypothetical protein
MALPRLRQAVVAATDLDATMAALEDALGVTAPFHDDLGSFGLRNAVYTLGDTFVEIVSPVQDGTAAGRHIERNGGDGGYMCMFEVSEEAATRKRIAEMGARIVHDKSHADIVDIHLHPKDVPGAIVAVNVTDPVGSWRWGGPAWKAQIPQHGPGELRGLTVAVTDPKRTAATWAQLLDIPADGTTVLLTAAGQSLHFVPVEDGRPERIVEVRAAVSGKSGTVEVAGVRFVREQI